MGATTVKAEDLWVHYPRWLFGTGITALRGVCLEAQAGEVVGVLGPNGSGKSTLLRTLAGGLSIRRGKVRILDHGPGDPAINPLVGYQPEGPLPMRSLSGRELLRFQAARLGVPRGRLVSAVEHWLTRVDLLHAADRRVSGYSTGMARRLALAMTLITDPRVVLLDEPSAGIDPLGSAMVVDLVRERRAAGATVLIASHHLDELEQVCDRVCILVSGQVRLEGHLDELLATDQRRLLVRGLPEAAIDELRRWIEARGGSLVEASLSRRPLMALFRDLMQS